MTVAADDVIQMTDNSHLLTAALLARVGVVGAFEMTGKLEDYTKKHSSLKNILQWIYNWKKNNFFIF